MRCRISYNIEDLEEYNKIYSWIPGKDGIRPTMEVLNKKTYYFDVIGVLYRTEIDYIYCTIFNQSSYLDSDTNKLVSSKTNISNRLLKQIEKRKVN